MSDAQRTAHASEIVLTLACLLSAVDEALLDAAVDCPLVIVTAVRAAAETMRRPFLPEQIRAIQAACDVEVRGHQKLDLGPLLDALLLDAQQASVS